MIKEIPLEEMKKVLIGILNSYVKFCDENNLRYYLAYGTLLGAVRHQGFIPWDDDVDVIMPRPDYIRFLRLTNDGLTHNLKVHSFEQTNNYIYPFAKIVDERTILEEKGVKKKYCKLGVYIDIFPMDGLPDDEKEISKHYARMGRLKTIHSICVISKNKWDNPIETIVKRMIKKVVSVYGYKSVLKHMDRLAQKYDFNETNKVGVVIGGYGTREVTNKTAFIDSILVEFEKNQYSGPSNYDEVLTSLYGDYMKLPPLEKRISNHEYKLYWKDDFELQEYSEGYKEFLGIRKDKI